MNALSRFAEIFRLRRRDVHEGLRVAVHEGKPRTLHLHHDAMVAAEGVTDVGHGEFDLRYPARLERFRLFETVSEFAAEDVATHELLVAAHPDLGRIRIRIGKVAGINI